MEMRRIVVALDGSEEAAAVLPYARRFATSAQAQVWLLGVIERSTDRVELSAALAAAAAGLREHDITATTVLRQGSAAAALLAVGDEVDADLIVLATRGRGGLTRLLLGSVAETVLKRGTRPMFIVAPEKAANRASDDVQFRRILVPLDGSSLAEQALPAAVMAATLFGSSVTLIRVRGYGSVWPQGSVMEREREVERVLAIEAQTYLDKVKAGLPPSLDVSTTVQRGDVAAELVEFIAQRAIDLVVMTTQGESGMRRMVLGSVADAVVRSGAPTLLLPPSA